MINMDSIPFNIIIEGLDNCGKDTQIKLLHSFLVSNFPTIPNQIFHYSAVPNISNKTLEEYSKTLYNDAFIMMKNNYENVTYRNFIYNRLHLGEFVYSPLYRNYDGSYIFDIEKKFKDYYFFKNHLYLIVFIDNVDNLISRDDGLSHSIDPIQKENEIKLFEEAFDRSMIFNKIIINIDSLSIEQVHNHVLNFIIGDQYA